MKDFTQDELESSRPNGDPLSNIQYCLTQLYADKKHSIENKVSPALTYEELIGALLSAVDEIVDLRESIDYLDSII